MQPLAPVGYLETGVLYCDDNLHRLSQFPDACVDLIYLDPPFFSNRNYEVIWGDEAEVRSFEDRFEGGIHVYIEWMRERMIELRRILKPGGSIYLHCDSHASHYLKVMMDEVFGRELFRNEIIWKRTSSHNDSRKWAQIQDSILFYAGRGYTSSQPADIVLDPFCGCGTTMAVAQEMGRQWIGIDISPTAVGLSATRLDTPGSAR